MAFAHATRKFTKEEVEFESPAKGSHHCSQCEHFILSGKCQIVRGSIKPGDWCRKFEAK